MFDKKKYWDNRKQGKRGQGEDPGIVAFHSPEEWKKTKKQEKIAEDEKRRKYYNLPPVDNRL